MTDTTTPAQPLTSSLPTEMATTTTTTPPMSALQTLLTTQGQEEAQSLLHPPHLENLAKQVMHNLQHQHRWTSLRIHRLSSPPSTTTSDQKATQTPLPRPLISGLPPQRLYIHPDEQIALLQAQKEAGKQGLGEVLPEREWVLPSQLREKWSLRRFGDVFDGISVVPPSLDESRDGKDGDEEDDEGEEEENRWRKIKRVVLATVDDDSTVVYYIVHDGIVKPRQN